MIILCGHRSHRIFFFFFYLHIPKLPIILIYICISNAFRKGMNPSSLPSHPVGWGCRRRRLHHCRRTRPLHNAATRLSVGRRWQPIMLQDEILMAKQSVTRQPKWSHDLQYSILALTGLENWSERADLISRSVISSSNTYDSSDRILQMVANKYLTLFYLKSTRRYLAEGQLHWNMNTWNYLNCVQTND